MDGFTASALTHLLVVADPSASRDWYVRVLDAEVVREYGGTSVVLELLGNWLLLVAGEGRQRTSRRSRSHRQWMPTWSARS